MSITMPGMVLMSDRASAPASTTARAISTISVTFGESLTIKGRVQTSRTAPVTRAASAQLSPNVLPSDATFGQEMFSSIAATPGVSTNFSTTATYSSTVNPATLTMTGVVQLAQIGAFSRIQASTPIF